MEAITQKSEHLVQSVTIIEIAPSDIIPEIYPSLKDFENKIIHDQQCQPETVDNALQTSIDSLLTEDQDTSIGSAAEEQPSQVAAPYWLLYQAIPLFKYSSVSSTQIPSEKHNTQDLR